MAGAASQAGDADSSRAPGLTSGLQGSVNVHRGALLLVPQWQCISSFVFYLSITFEPLEVGLSYITCIFLVLMLFRSYKNVWPCDSKCDLLPTYLKNINISRNFKTISDRALMFHVYTSCDVAFLFIPKFVKSWLRPWPLAYISEQFSIYYIFGTIRAKAFIFHMYILVMRLFRSY